MLNEFNKYPTMISIVQYTYIKHTYYDDLDHH